MTDFQHGTPTAYSTKKCRCDECRAWKKAKDHAYYLANQERIKARTSIYYRDNTESMVAANKRYRDKNAEVIKAKKAEYAKANSARLTAKSVKWQKDNPERRKEQSAKYRDGHRLELRKAGNDRYARQMATDPEAVRKQRREYAKTPYGRALYYSAQNLRRRGVPYTKESREWIASIDWDTEICTYCEVAPATEIDHIVPLTEGGTGDRENLTPVCRSCNARKGNLYLAEFLGFVEPERMFTHV